MMIRTNLKRAVCFALLSGACVSAHATTTNLGSLGAGVPTPFSGTVAPAGTFNDIFTFTLPVNGGSGYSVINFPLNIPGVGSFNSLLTNLTLVSNPDGILFNSDDSVLAQANSLGGASALSLTWGPSAGGPMYLNLTGIANGTLGGLYNGAISATAVLVPEPETWGMMLAGLGLMLAVAGRRSRK